MVDYDNDNERSRNIYRAALSRASGCLGHPRGGRGTRIATGSKPARASPDDAEQPCRASQIPSPTRSIAAAECSGAALR